MSAILEDMRRKEREEFAQHSHDRGRDWGSDGEWAFDHEKSVRDALAAADPEIARSLELHPGAVRSSYSPRGRSTDWVAPDWRTIMIFTEYGIGDPYAYQHVHDAFNRAIASLNRAWSMEGLEWSWDSINPAVQVFRVDERGSRHRKMNPPSKQLRPQKVVAKTLKEISPKFERGFIVNDPASLVRELADYMDLTNEMFVAIFMNVRNKVVGYTEFTGGSVSSVEVHPSGIFQAALLAGAAGIVTIHNHPSGDPTPSAEDRLLWARLREVGKMMGVPVVDNLVIGDGGRYFSEMEAP